MKILILGILLLTFRSFAQVSIFDCDAYNSVNETQINTGPQLFYRPCILLDDQSGYNFSLSENYIIESSSFIHIKPDINSEFNVSDLNSAGAIHLRIKPNNMDWDIAVMNNVKLDNLGRYEKLEIGITLPEPLKTKLENFIIKQENPGMSFSPQDIINPFLEWELDIEAEFTHIATNTVQKIDGFFTIDKKRNYTTLLWDDIPNDYHMRFRFAPPLNGEWTVKIKIKTNNNLISESLTFPLFVVESGKHGYITTHANHRNFELDGEVIFPVGQNFPCPDLSQNLNASITGVPDPYQPTQGITEFKNNVVGWQTYIDLIDNYGQMGGRFTRIFMAPHAGLVEWEEKGNYYRRMHHAFEIDSVIEVHEKNNMFTMFDLLLHNYFMTWGDYDTWQWDWDRHLYCADTEEVPPGSGNYVPVPCGVGANMVQHGERYYPNANIHSWELDIPVHPYNDNPGNYLDPNQNPKMPHEMFLLESDIVFHEQRTRYYISRYGYSTAIYMWEQMDETFHTSEDAFATKTENGGEQNNFYFNPNSAYYNETHAAVNNYVRRMNKFIREHLEHKHQLLALNYSNLYKDDFPSFSHDSSIYDPNGDCLSRSFYQILPNGLLSGSIGNHDDPDNNLVFYAGEKTTAYQDVFRIKHNYYSINQKYIPVFFGESGSDAGVFTNKSCMQGTDEKIDNMRFGFLGIAGFNKWHYWNGNNYGVYESIIRAQNHMNGPDVSSVIGSIDYQQGRQFEEIVSNSTGLENNKGEVLEMQYYLTQDKNSAVGYIYNRTVNYKTANGGNCHPSGGFDPSNMNNFNSIHTFNWQDDGPLKKLKMIHMPLGADYLVDYYTYPNGNYLFTQSASVGSNEKFIMEFPELDQERALVWFVAHRTFNKNLVLDTNSTELAIERTAEVFPNPTLDQLYVTVDLGDFLIEDINGKIQDQNVIRVEDKYIILDVSNYVQGVFIIKSKQYGTPIKFVKI